MVFKFVCILFPKDGTKLGLGVEGDFVFGLKGVFVWGYLVALMSKMAML